MHHAKVLDFNRQLTSGGAWLMSRGSYLNALGSNPFRRQVSETSVFCMPS